MAEKPGFAGKQVKLFGFSVFDLKTTPLAACQENPNVAIIQEPPQQRGHEEEEFRSKPVKLFGVWMKKDVKSIIDNIKQEENQYDAQVQHEYVNARRIHRARPVEEDIRPVQLGPYKYEIRKKLTLSDVNSNSRLLLHKDVVRVHIMPYLNAEQRKDVESGKGIKVAVFDVDTSSMHTLIFKKGRIGYIFKSSWSPSFVKRRGLKKFDEIGMSWDRNNSRFVFSLLRRRQ